jgi:hypothetical protein
VGTPGRQISWCTFKLTFLTLFRPRTGMAGIFRACAQSVDNFQRNSFTCGNLSLLSPLKCHIINQKSDMECPGMVPISLWSETWHNPCQLVVLNFVHVCLSKELLHFKSHFTRPYITQKYMCADMNCGKTFRRTFEFHFFKC